MFIENYYYKSATKVDGKGVYIPELTTRIGMTKAFNKLCGEYLYNFSPLGPTAFLYAGGPMIHACDSVNNKFNTKENNVIIKQQAGDKVYRLASKYKNIEFVTINGDSCAASMKLLNDTKLLFKEGYITDVIIYSENMVTEAQLEFFRQLGIDLLCGDGVVVMHLTAKRTANTIAEITDTAWHWSADATSMTVSEDGYTKVLSKLNYNSNELTVIKPHGSGTVRNDSAEDTVVENIFPGIPVIKYKQTIGHTQGASALIEMCMLLDEVDTCNAIIMASGLGAVYGACTLIK